MARTMMLLDRYGIVSREAALAEDVPGGFAEVYKVLKAMEESGKVRRGYFVEGLSGAQFAHSHALERLRAQAQALNAQPGSQAVPLDDVIVLCAVDPANPYGALIDWPQVAETATVKPRRQVGAWLVLVRGRAMVYVFAGARHLLTFDTSGSDVPDALGVAFDALHRLPRTSRRKTLIIEKVNSRPVLKSEHAPLLQECGFVPDYLGLRRVRTVPEGDTIHTLAGVLRPQLVGHVVHDIWSPALTLKSLIGEEVSVVEAKGKHLFLSIGGGCVRSHLGMYGSWHRYARSEGWEKTTQTSVASIKHGGCDFRVFQCLNS